MVRIHHNMKLTYHTLCLHDIPCTVSLKGFDVFFVLRLNSLRWSLICLERITNHEVFPIYFYIYTEGIGYIAIIFQSD